MPAPDPARKAYSGRRFDPEQKNLFERGRDDAVALPVRVDVGAEWGRRADQGPLAGEVGRQRELDRVFERHTTAYCWPRSPVGSPGPGGAPSSSPIDLAALASQAGREEVDLPQPNASAGASNWPAPPTSTTRLPRRRPLAAHEHRHSGQRHTAEHPTSAKLHPSRCPARSPVGPASKTGPSTRPPRVR